MHAQNWKKIILRPKLSVQIYIIKYKNMYIFIYKKKPWSFDPINENVINMYSSKTKKLHCTSF